MVVCDQCSFAEETNVHATDATECVDDPRRQLEDLETQILRVEALLSQLLQKRIPLKRKINNRFSPVLQLPVEISSEIFVTCFPPNSWESWGSKTPLALGKVCSAWRDLAWSIPWLWSTVSLDIEQCSTTHAALLSEWVERSVQLPLSIHLRLVCDILTPPEVRSAANLLDVVAAHSERWRDIDFDIPFFFPNGLQYTGPIPFPLLTNMSVHVMGGRQVEVFRVAPSLQNVCLKGFAPNSVALPLSQLTQIRLGPTTADECLSVLGGAPNLTHCVFEDILRSDVMNPSPVLASRLESFKVFSSTRTPLSEILDVVSMPAAREFVFHVTGNLFPHWSFVSLVSRSSITLERLSLTGIKISERNLWECFRAVPSVVYLELIDLEYITDETLRMLNPVHSWTGTPSSYLLPNLGSFVFAGGIDKFPNLTDMLGMRWRRSFPERPADGFTVARLQSAVIKTPTTNIPDEDSMAELRRFVSEGMQLSLLTQDCIGFDI